MPKRPPVPHSASSCLERILAWLVVEMLVMMLNAVNLGIFLNV